MNDNKPGAQVDSSRELFTLSLQEIYTYINFLLGKQVFDLGSDNDKLPAFSVSFEDKKRFGDGDLVTGLKTSNNFSEICQEDSFTKAESEAEEFLTACFMDRCGKGVVPGLGIVIGPVFDVLRQFEGAWKATEATLHVTLCATSHRGRKRADIESCRVLCLDIDREGTTDEIQGLIRDYGAQLVVESSPSHFHVYWSLASGSSGLSLDEWETVQLAIAQAFGGDDHLAERSHLVRVPGVPRITKHKEFFCPRIVYLNKNTAVRLNRDEVYQNFPWIQEEYENAKRQKREYNSQLKKIGKISDPKILLSLDNKGVIGNLAGQGRNAFIYEMVKRHVADLSNEISTDGGEESGVSEDAFENAWKTAFDLASNLNSSFEINIGGPIDLRELEAVCRSALKNGLIRREIRLKNIAEQKKKIKELLVGENSMHVIGVNGDIGKNGTNAVSTEQTAFEYNYSDTKLAVNRFTETSLYGRVIQRFRNKLVRVQGEIWAFNSDLRVWRVQLAKKHSELAEMVQACAFDILNDPDFVQGLCTTSTGEISHTKKKAAEEKYMSARLNSQICTRLLHSTEIVEEENCFDTNNQVMHITSGRMGMCAEKGELLNTITVRDVRAEDRLLCKSHVIWDQSAGCPRWENFLREVFSENETPKEMCDFMQQLFGYSISGSLVAQKIFCHFGIGANGKSKVLSALLSVVGSYGTIIDPDDMAKRKGSFGIRFERVAAKMEGKRVAIIDDVDTETVWNEAFVKNATALHIRARAEYEQSRVIENHCKLHLGLNMAPVPESENFGILRRLCIIPYHRQFDSNSLEHSNRIDAFIREEKNGIFRWAIEGLNSMCWSNLIYPEEVEEEIQKYRRENFVMESAVKEIFEPNENEFQTTQDIISALNNRCMELGVARDRINSKQVASAMKTAFGINSKNKKISGATLKGYSVKVKEIS